MPIMEWTDKLSVKINSIDDEHKKLVALINKLSDAMSQGQGHKALDDILIELVDYTNYHFKYEEDALQKHNYPGFAKHKKMHQEFANKIGETKTQYENGSISLSIPIMNFLTSWLQNHIMKVDAEYSAFLIKAGMK